MCVFLLVAGSSQSTPIEYVQFKKLIDLEVKIFIEELVILLPTLLLRRDLRYEDGLSAFDLFL